MKKVLFAVVLLLSAMLLVSCAPKDQSAAKEKMTNLGYAVVVDGTVIPTALQFVGVKGIQTVIVCSKTVEDEEGNTSAEALTAVYFDTTDNAKASYKAIDDYAKRQASNNETKQAGNWIYYGTSQAMKDFTK